MFRIIKPAPNPVTTVLVCVEQLYCVELPTSDVAGAVKAVQTDWNFWWRKAKPVATPGRLLGVYCEGNPLPLL